MKFQKTQLTNGLEIIAEVDPTAASMAGGFFVRTGSRDETPNISGVSHFLEHMIFKGTERRTAMDVNLEYDRIGAQYNAFTSEENTVFYASVLPEFQDDCLDILCDILRPSLRTEDFDLEKGVIQEEIAMYKDRPQFRLYDKLMGGHFAGHPLGKPILGTTQSIQEMKRNDMQAYFEKQYSPTNVSLAAVGNVDFEALQRKASQMCSSWEAFETTRDMQPCDGAKTQKIIVDPKLSRQNIGLMSRAPSSQDDLRFAAQLLGAVLGDVTGSRLYYALIETGIADEAHVSYNPLDGTGMILTFVSTDPDSAGKALRIVLDEFEKFLAEGPTDAELQAAKNKIASGTTIGGELPMGRLISVGFGWMYRKEYQTLSEQIDRLFAVTGQEVLDLARTCELGSTTTLSLGPLESLTK